MRKEKRDIAQASNEKIEMIREFWRNNIKEGSSRAGAMVQRAHNARCVLGIRIIFLSL